MNMIFAANFGALMRHAFDNNKKQMLMNNYFDHHLYCQLTLMYVEFHMTSISVLLSFLFVPTVLTKN